MYLSKNFAGIQGVIIILILYIILLRKYAFPLIRIDRISR